MEKIEFKKLFSTFEGQFEIIEEIFKVNYDNWKVLKLIRNRIPVQWSLKFLRERSFESWSHILSTLLLYYNVWKGEWKF